MRKVFCHQDAGGMVGAPDGEETCVTPILDIHEALGFGLGEGDRGREEGRAADRS